MILNYKFTFTLHHYPKAFKVSSSFLFNCWGLPHPFYSNFKPGSTCRITVIYVTLKDGNHMINIVKLQTNVLANETSSKMALTLS